MPSERLEMLATELIAVADEIRQQRFETIDDPVREADTALDVLPACERSETLRRWCELAGQLYRVRRRRDQLFGSIFGEPAWDILLDLFVMEAKGKRVPVSSACIASGASHSTALRQIDELVRHKLVLRERDEHDKRRSYVKLSGAGMRKLAVVLEQFAELTESRIVR